MARIPNNPRPAPQAEPPRLSLLRTITADEVDDQRVGFNFYPESCGQSGVGNPELCNTDHDKTIGAGPGVVDVWPVYAWAGDKCSTFGYPERDWAARARRQLAATLSYQVARELWRGEESEAAEFGSPSGDQVNAFLASTASDEVAAGVNVIDGFAALEQALGDCYEGQRGAIHVPRAVATQAKAENLIRREGALLLTELDTLVIVDAGYDGSGPGRTPAETGSVWGYATGLPIVQLGPEHLVPERLEQAIDRRTNTIEYRAERQFAAGWDGCCHFAVEFDVAWPTIGGS